MRGALVGVGDDAFLPVGEGRPAAVALVVGQARDRVGGDRAGQLRVAVLVSQRAPSRRRGGVPAADRPAEQLVDVVQQRRRLHERAIDGDPVRRESRGEEGGDLGHGQGVAKEPARRSGKEQGSGCDALGTVIGSMVPEATGQPSRPGASRSRVECRAHVPGRDRACEEPRDREPVRPAARTPEPDASPARLGPDGQPAARADRDRPVAVRPQHARARALEPLERPRAGWPYVVAAPADATATRGWTRGHERVGRGRPAAVMRAPSGSRPAASASARAASGRCPPRRRR